MDREARLALSQLILDARAAHEVAHPLQGERRPRTCPKCNTVGSWTTHADLEFHVKQGDKLLTQTLLGSRECLFCHYVEDRV